MTPHGRQKSDPARTLALSILNSLNQGGQTLDALLEDMDTSEALDLRDRAFLNTLVYGVLRWRRRIDATLQGFSHIPIRKIDPKILNILRLGLFQIQYLDRVPPSAAVNTAVEMSKAIAAPWVAKFVNAVLRKIAGSPLKDPHRITDNRITDSQITDSQIMDKPTTAALATELSFPDWLVSRWRKRYGDAETQTLCQALNAIPPTTVRTHTLKYTREELKHELSGEVATLWFTPHSPDGISFTGPHKPIGRLSAFLTGGFQVQDEGAQLITRLFAPKPGETILDACAGLGGKTGHIAQLMKNRGRIIAMDISSEKRNRLTTEMTRLGIDIVAPLTADINHLSTLEIPATFDRILLDAPCSGLGVLRRNPDTKWSFLEKDLDRCRQRQCAFLHLLAPRVALGGRLMFVVCSTEPEENEWVVDDFLANHPDFHVDPLTGTDEIAPSFFTERGFFRSLPHRDHMDGFFAALFRKKVLPTTEAVMKG